MDYAVPTTEHSVFVPSEQLTGGSNGARNANPAAGNYRGDPTLPANIGSHCPDHLNTSLWLTGLPRGMEVPTLLDHIAVFKVGRVRSTVINDANETCPTAAATISFFRRQDADFLYRLIQKRQMVIGGMCPRVQWNRNKVMEEPADNRSRVLLIAGDPRTVEAEELDRFFKERFFFNLDVIITHEQAEMGSGLISCVECRFGSWRCQAQFGMKAIRKELKGIVIAEYGLDPCAV